MGSGKSAERAGLLLELEFRKLELPELMDLFQTLGEAAQRAAAKPQRRASAKVALKILVQSLYVAAEQRGGRLTVFEATNKATNKAYSGSLLQALEILKKYLPEKMFPRGHINGRSILYFYDRIPKPRSTKQH